MIESVLKDLEISSSAWREVSAVLQEVEETWKEPHEKIYHYWQARILKAMQEVKLSSTDFHWTTGYGYGDQGRDKVEDIFAKVFGGEEAIVRPTIVSGTHAIFSVLRTLLHPGDRLVSLGGPLYDTIQKAIGITGNEPGNLIEQGILYEEVPLNQGSFDLSAISELSQEPTVAMIQRSPGYSSRHAFTTEDMEKAIANLHEKFPDCVVFVDNCYGEFTQMKEPLEIGADVIAGSLIKNPGGGLAYTGGYIIGKSPIVERIANTLTTPGIGKECGLSFGLTRQVLQGLFLAPRTVYENLIGIRLLGKLMENKGFHTCPHSDDPRSDIILSIDFHDPEKLISFCQAIQSISPVDAHFSPTPWNMPGYDDPVIMAAGGFIEGSSIELSADGPLRQPYTVYVQGTLTLAHMKLAAAKVLSQWK